MFAGQRRRRRAWNEVRGRRTPAFNDSDFAVHRVGPRFFFSAYAAGTQYELYKSNGMAAGTKLVEEINAGGFMGSSPADLTNVGSKLMFTADDGAHGTELWKSDGTKRGTKLVEDINPAGSSNRATC